MANNRMWMVCSECPADKFWVAKYYPMTGWYMTNEHFFMEFNEWLDKHKHGSFWGHEISMEYEMTKEEVKNVEDN